jgi:transcription antitermination factor NusG
MLGNTYVGSEMESLVVAPAQWYAVQTRSRHEKKVSAELDKRGIVNYLPTFHEVHRWSDRKKSVEVPVFPGYAFVHTRPAPEDRYAVLQVWGVLNFVGRQNLGDPIPESEIDAIRGLVASRAPFTPHPFLKVGQRVVVRGGALDGLEGIFVSHDNNRRLVISSGTIERSIAVSIEGYDIQPV